MKKPFAIFLMGLLLLAGCSQEKDHLKVKWQRLRYHVKQEQRYKEVSLKLARDNRELRIQNNKMVFEIQALKGELQTLAQERPKYVKVRKKQIGRALASMDWSAEQEFMRAQNEYKRKNYAQAFAYFQAFAKKFPEHKRIDDRFLFRTGLAAFESRQYDQAAWYFQQLVTLHPQSKLHRSAKLWAGLSHLKMGDKKKFIQVVKEFKNKYQNTPEWKVLKAHYEKIIVHKI